MAKHSEVLPLFPDEAAVKPQGPVECLGMTFENDDKRREYFLEKLREKLEDPEFRKIEGFPIGSDEDILALSDPPYYTACPNPFIEDLIRHYGKPHVPEMDNYRREPFAADVSEGKNDPIYNAHSYHTKVPHKAIMRYILHYTEPWDVVFDGFCGTGMTGVAAQFCGDRDAIESLGYRVDNSSNIYQQEISESGRPIWRLFSTVGCRRAILTDLSPAAVFIAYNYNTPVDVQVFSRESKKIFKDIEKECGWMYETLHSDNKTKGRINYTVWTDVFFCFECGEEIVFWKEAIDQAKGKVKDNFPCPHCNVTLSKRNMKRAWIVRYDVSVGKSIRQVKQVPVLINYRVGNTRYDKKPNELDIALIQKIENEEIPYWYPSSEMPDGFNTPQPKKSHGITHVHHFFTKRNLRR